MGEEGGRELRRVTLRADRESENESRERETCRQRKLLT